MNTYIESTNLEVTATMRDIEKLCDEAKQYHFSTVTVLPYYTALASSLLKESTVQVETVVGYPLGLQTTAVKSYEAIDAVQNGASEIGMMINTAAIKNGDYDFVQEEIEEIRDSIDGKVMKVIINPSHLTEEEILKVIRICNEAFVHYIEINVGTSDLENVVPLFLEHKSEVLEIKINSSEMKEEELWNLIEKGISRIGLTNAGFIMKGENK